MLDNIKDTNRRLDLNQIFQPFAFIIACCNQSFLIGIQIELNLSQLKENDLMNVVC